MAEYAKLEMMTTLTWVVAANGLVLQRKNPMKMTLVPTPQLNLDLPKEIVLKASAEI
jgi:hypothetical protein